VYLLLRQGGTVTVQSEFITVTAAATGTVGVIDCVCLSLQYLS
jgi:hypothetical protein